MGFGTKCAEVEIQLVVKSHHECPGSSMASRHTRSCRQKTFGEDYDFGRRGLFGRERFDAALRNEVARYRVNIAGDP